MNICKQCNSRMQKNPNLADMTIMFNCPRCHNIQKGTASDTLMYKSPKYAEPTRETFMKNIRTDAAANRIAAEPCPNCGLPYRIFINASDRSETKIICEECDDIKV